MACIFIRIACRFLALKKHKKYGLEFQDECHLNIPFIKRSVTTASKLPAKGQTTRQNIARLYSNENRHQMCHIYDSFAISMI